MRDWSASCSIRISPTALFQLGLRHCRTSFHARTAPSQPGASAMPGTHTTSSPETTSGHVVPLVTRHLRVHEQILHLLAPACEPVARPSRADLEPGEVALDSPRAELDRALQPERVVLADRADAAAEVGGLRARRRREELEERVLERSRKPRPLSCEREQVLVGAGMQAAQERQDLVPDEPALRVGVRGVHPEREPVRAAVLLRLLAPDRQQRADDAVLAAHLDPARASGGDEPVEDGLDLVRGGVAGRAQAPALGQAIALLPPRSFCRGRGRGEPRAYGGQDLGAHELGAMARVLLRLLAAQAVVHVDGGDAIAEPRRARARGRSSPPRPRRGSRRPLRAGSGRARGRSARRAPGLRRTCAHCDLS